MTNSLAENGSAKKLVGFRCSEPDFRRLKTFCAANNTTIQAVCNEAVRRYIDAQERRRK